MNLGVSVISIGLIALLLANTLAVASGGGEIASTAPNCGAGSWAISAAEDSTGNLTVSCTIPPTESDSSPSACPANNWVSRVTEVAGVLTLTCTAPTQEIASNPSACNAGNWITQVVEDASGNITFTCTAPNQEAASSPSACPSGQYLTLVTESAAGVMTLTCNNIPDILQTCTSTCSLTGVSEAVAANSASALNLNLPAILLNSYRIDNLGAGQASICPVTGTNFYVGGITYTNASCFKLNQNYQIYIWGDGNNWYGIPSQIQWSSLTGFPANCAAGNYVYGLGATLTCAKPTNMVFTSNANTCTDTTNGGTGHMMGFATTYTTQAAPFIHTIMVTLNWKLTGPTTVTTNTQYQFSYGSTATPTCNAAKTGTQIGNIYEYLNGVAQTTAEQRDFSETVVISGLTASTTYWFDLNVIDSSTASWIYSLPQISVIEQ